MEGTRKATGRFYQLMMQHIRNVLDDIPSIVPSYTDQQGYELSGFVWFQGFNDVIDRTVYPRRDQPGGYDERGLLGFAFHPDYENNGRVYIYTSEPPSGVADFSTLSQGELADHQSVVTELTILNPLQTAGPAVILGGSEREILRLDQRGKSGNLLGPSTWRMPSG